MSAAGTHTKDEREERNGVSTEEKMDGTKKKEGRGKKTEGKRKTGRRWESALSEIRQDLLCHVAVRQQPVWSESGAASLDIPQAVTLTQIDPGEEQETSHALQRH